MLKSSASGIVFDSGNADQLSDPEVLNSNLVNIGIQCCLDECKYRVTYTVSTQTDLCEPVEIEDCDNDCNTLPNPLQDHTYCAPEKKNKAHLKSLLL